MSVFNVVRPIVNPIVRSIVNPRGGGFAGLLNLYPGAAAAYSLRALSSGWLAGDVVEVRPSHGAAAQSFTASQITSGAMLSFVNGGTTDLYNSARYFNGTNTGVSFGDVLDKDGSTSFFIEATIVPAQSSSNSSIVDKLKASPNYEGYTFRVNNGELTFIIGATPTDRLVVSTSGANISDGSIHVCRVTYDGSKNATGVSFLVDGVSQSVSVLSDNFTGNSTSIGANLSIGIRNIDGASSFKGTIYSVNINNQAAYSGLGTSVTAWQDTIGSNNGTETNGAAYTGQPFDGFVSKWYDQSGNGNDATQATTTQQPKIVSAGSLVTGGLDFDNVDDYLDSINTISFGTGPRSIFATCAPDSITANADGIVQLNIQTVSTGEGWLLTPELATRTNAVTWISSTPATLSQNNLISNIYTSGNLHAGNSMFLNGASVSRTSGTDGAINTSTSEIRIGNGFGGNTAFDGAIRELIIYNSDQSANRVAIETNINDHYSIYA